MLVSIFTTLSLSLVPSALASPALRATTFCEQLVVSCAAAGPQSITNPWAIPACIYGATCFGGSRPADAFLVAVATERNNPSSAQASVNLPMLTVETFNTISTDKIVVTQQNFIDGVYSTLDSSNGPYPDVSFVISSFQRISIWTRLCSGRGIPWRNFADYFKYSASVNSSGCTSTATTAVSISPPTISVPSSSITASSVTFIPLPPLSSRVSYTHATATSTSVSSPPTTSPPTYSIVSTEPSCQKVFEECLRTVNFNLYNIWTVKPCVLAAVCFPGDHNVDAMLTAVYVYRTGNHPSTAPKSVDQPSLSEAQFRSISTNGYTITTQNWIDAYYGLLSGIGGPFPTSADVVIEYFRRVRNWTAFCGSDGIRYQAFAYYFNWSSSVPAPVVCQ